MIIIEDFGWSYPPGYSGVPDDNIEDNESGCPICGGETSIEHGYEWCDTCDWNEEIGKE